MGRDQQKRALALMRKNHKIRRQKRGLPVLKIIPRRVPTSEKCIRCVKKHIQCDGRQPCNACGTRYTCIKQGKEKDPKCVPCNSKGRACDREQPCNTCKKKECGLHALALSIEAQQPEVQTPTVAELREIQASGEFVQANEAVNRDNENNLFVDQIALILRLWGDTTGMSFQLGVILENAEPMVIFGEEGRTTIWIHNDNAARQEGVEYNHFSGVRLIEAETMETQNLSTAWQESSGEEGKEDAVDDNVSFYFPKKRRVMMATTIQTDKSMPLPCSERDPHDDVYDSDQDKLEKDNENEVDADIKFFKQQRRNAMIAKKNVGELPDPQTYAKAMRCSDAEAWTEAMLVERQSLEKTGTFKLVHTSEIPEGVIPLKSKWVYKRKLDQNNEVKRHKAQLVAKGYLQREGFNFNEKYSAVIKSTSYRILIALAAIFR